MIYIVRCSNNMVTDYYLDIIKMIFENCDEIVMNYNTTVKKEDIVVTATIKDFVKTYIKGNHKIIYWMQGIEAEESFLKHRSYLRRSILNILTKFVLKKAKAIFYVSEAMRNFEETKFQVNTRMKSMIMPCFNTTFDKNSVNTPEKYKKNIFAYVGSLSAWQCFDETVDFYKKVEEMIGECEFRVFTPEQNRAKEILEKKEVKNFTVDFVAPDKLKEKLAPIKFGFILRDNISVNNVSTPTKISSYLAAGVIPIFSDCILDFSEKAKLLKYIVEVKDIKKIPENLIEFCTNEIDIAVLSKEYNDFFDLYYNPRLYIDTSKNWALGILRNLHE